MQFIPAESESCTSVRHDHATGRIKSLDRTAAARHFELNSHTKWTWSVRHLSQAGSYLMLDAASQNGDGPRVGDIAVAEVTGPGYHSRIYTAQNERLRLYPGDKLVGVFGNRYATDAYEAEVTGGGPLHILTSAGMLGTVISQHAGMKKPTELRLLGYLGDRSGRRLNLKPASLDTVLPERLETEVYLVVGTGMNSGKTTAAARLVKALLRHGTKVAACKLTGSVCHNDLFELRATAARDVRDFSDYGFPSTYRCETAELDGLFSTMLADAAAKKPEVVVMEIADGILQRETQMLLASPLIRRHVAGVVLAAPCASSALFGLQRIKAAGHGVVAVSGVITNSPLFIREFSAESNTPICSSRGDASSLAEQVLAHVRAAQR